MDTPNRQTPQVPEDERHLYEAILQLRSVEECRAFFRDLCTPAEIQAIQERWRVAVLLDGGDLSYRQIHDQTGVSLATITRVARFLQHESWQGYKLVLQRLKSAKTTAPEGTETPAAQA